MTKEIYISRELILWSNLMDEVGFRFRISDRTPHIHSLHLLSNQTCENLEKSISFDLMSNYVAVWVILVVKGEHRENDCKF